MTEPSIETLTTYDSLGSRITVPAENAVAHWYSDGGGQSDFRLYRYDQDRMEVVPFERETYDPDGWESLRWTDAGFFVQSNPGLYRLSLDGELTAVEIHDAYTHLHAADASGQRLVYVLYDDPWSNESRWTLRVYDRETETDTVLTEHPEQEYHAGFGPEDERIAYRDNPDESLGTNRHVVATPDGEVEATFHVGDADRDSRQHRWHPDGERVVVEDRSTGWYRVGLHDWRADETTWFGTGEANERFLALSPDGETLVTARSRDGRTAVYRYPVDDPDAGRELDLPDGIVEWGVCLDLPAAGNELLLHHETATRPTNWLAYDLDAGESRTLVETTTDALSATPLVEPEYVTYESRDGLDIDAVLYQVGTVASPAPAVVYVHGGPTDAERCDFDPFAQFLASRGYAVLQPNYRGSTDRDRSFEAALKGVYGRGDVDDVAAGGDWLADREWIDGDRLAVVGHSYGAYNAAMQTIEYPDRWRAAVPENGIFDMTGERNQYSLRHLVADPEEESREAFKREISPVHRVDEVDCFVCVVQGSEDSNLDQAEEFVAALEDRGWREGEQFRFEVVEGHGHVIHDVEPYWRLLEEVLDERVV